MIAVTVMLFAGVLAAWAETPDYAAEAAVIAATKGRVQRNGPTLLFHSADGTSQTLIDQEQCGADGQPADENHCEHHALFAYLPDRHAFIVKTSAYEGGSFTWINERNGQSVRVEGEPHFSPDGGRFVAVEASNAAPYVIQVWRLTDAMPILEWESPPIATVGYEFTGWNSDDEVELKYTIWNETKPQADLPARLVYSAANDPPWMLQGGGTPR
jgi:hypothetical protein